MFEQSILESSPHWKTRRPWTALASSGLQVLLLGLLILVPILRPDALPLRLRALAQPLPEPYNPGGEPAGPVASGPRPVIDNTGFTFVQPHQIPLVTYAGPDGPSGSRPSASSYPGPGCSTCPVGITPDMARVFAAPPVIPRPPAPRSVVISGGVIEGYLVQQVQPVYPQIAKLASVQGDVILQAVIGNDGTIQQLHAVSGHPWLIPPALDAVRQWRYRPYRLNGQPVEVETQITVRFVLAAH